MRNEGIKWMVLAACGVALPAMAGDYESWSLPGWDSAAAPVMVDIADGGRTVTVFLADPPDPDLGAGDPPSEYTADPPSEVTGDPPTEADPPSELTGDPPTEADPPDPDLDMHIVVDTRSIGSLKITDSEGYELHLVYVGDPFKR